MARRTNDGNVRRGKARVGMRPRKEKEKAPARPKPKATAPNTPPAYPMQPGQNPPFYVGPGDNPEFQFGPTPAPRPSDNQSRVKTRRPTPAGDRGGTPRPQQNQPRKNPALGEYLRNRGGGGGQGGGGQQYGSYGQAFLQGGREGLMDQIYGNFGADYQPRGVQPGGPMGHMWADPRGSHSLASVIQGGYQGPMNNQGRGQAGQTGQMGQPRPQPQRPGRFTASDDRRRRGY